MKFKRILIASMLLALLIPTVLAQESAPTNSSPDASFWVPALYTLFGAVIMLVAGGVGLLQIAPRLNKDPEAMAAVDKMGDRLRDSYPPETFQFFERLADTLEASGKILREFADDDNPPPADDGEPTESG